SLLLRFLRSKDGGAGLGHRLVVVIDPGHADAAEAGVTEQDRDAALDTEIVRRHQELDALLDPLSERGTRPAAEGRRTPFCHRHLHRVHAVDVWALQIEQMPGVVDHCDRRLALDLGAVFLGGGDDLLDVVGRQARLLAHGAFSCNVVGYPRMRISLGCNRPPSPSTSRSGGRTARPHRPRHRPEPLVRRLADWTTPFAAAPVPPATAERARAILLDTLACALYAAADDKAASAIRTAERLSSDGAC